MMMMMMNSKNRIWFDHNIRQEHRTMLYRNTTNDDDDDDDDDLGGYRCVVRDCRDCDWVIEFVVGIVVVVVVVVVKDGTSTGIDDAVDWLVGIRLLFVLEEVVVLLESVVIVVGEWWCDFRFHGSIGIRIVIVVVRSPLVHSW